MQYVALFGFFYILLMAVLCLLLWNQPVRVKARVATVQQDTERQPTDISSQSWATICRHTSGLNDTFHCPCGKSYRHAKQYLAHQDKCWAWGHYDSLFLTRNRAGGLQARGDRWRIPAGVKARVSSPSNNGCPKPTYPSYGANGFGHVSMHHELLCGTKWVRAHQHIAMPEPSIDITFNSNGANRPVSLVDVAEMYPKMVKKFGAIIKIA